MHYALILLVAASRFLPHPPNVACVGALGLFAGCYLVGRRAYLVPAAAMLLSDVVGHTVGWPGMGLYSLTTMLAVYLGVIAAVPVGRYMKKASGIWKYPVASLVASSAFFLISNFGVWLGPWYPSTLSGLAACFANAVPFFGYTVAGDLIFTGVLFGVWELSRNNAWSGLPASRANAKIEA
jgi:xanthosine utilization system XapX-like protein